jgi:DNA polymerase-1
MLQKAPTLLPQVVYCTGYAEAVAAFAEIVREAHGELIGLDIETAPTVAEAERGEMLLVEQAKLKGKLKAAKKASARDPALAAEAKLLATRIKYANTAALDPHRGRIRLVQVYAGGERVAVIDVFKIGPRVLALLDGLDVVIHNAAFELGFLDAAGVELGEVHCTLQVARLTLGENSTSLAAAAEAYFGIALDKTDQASNWSTLELSHNQIEYAALDAVMAYRLAGVTLPTLGPQASAYEIQIAAVPAAVRMKQRGVWLDGDAHATFMHVQQAKRAETVEVFKASCGDMGLTAIAAIVPSTPAEKRAVLDAILTSDELAHWKKTEKSGELSTARNELKRAGHYPPIKALVELSKLDKLLTAFGTTLTTFVSPVTGRIHANYRVAATASGRASCSYPNMQQAPRDPAFRALFKPASGMKYVGADFASMELRAEAHITGDRAMTAAFRDGHDLHRLTASRMLN